ncbi:MAG: hypothetical protein IPJ03_15875 [Ignavibacteriales bacterium]|nr:hypothetical protein [Ignavibacteriales bacterium]
MKLHKNAVPCCIEFEMVDGKIGESCKEPPIWIMNKRGWGFCAKHWARMTLLTALQNSKRERKSNEI